MTTQHRQQQLSRLFIPPSQQPMAFENAPMYSPALPTSIQQGMHPPYPMHGANPLQTPMQPVFFPPPPPGAPGRPGMHRAHPSVAQLAAMGIMPPPHMPMPMAPLGAGFPPQMLVANVPPFVPRSKRAPSVSTGGPPKAVLGGPQRKVSPLPPPAAPAAAAAAATVPKGKKVIVKLPRETMAGGDGAAPTHAPWARVPFDAAALGGRTAVAPPELVSVEAYPPDSWRRHLPPTVDVFLPGKLSWDTIKQQEIEEKLEKLGVEKGAGTLALPQIIAPHARAASISSPADPALLFFKLNKLQQSQNASAAGSLSASPQPPLSATSTSPGSLPPRFQQTRHGQTMSLVQPPSFQAYNAVGAFNPFGPQAVLGSDQISERGFSPGFVSQDMIHAPQGRVPTNVSSLAPPASLSRPESRPDFLRGFGLDATKEEEEPEEEPLQLDADLSVELQEDEDEDYADQDQDGMSTVAQTRMHSRHVSRLSAALSLRSVGGVGDDTTLLGGNLDAQPLRSPVVEVEVDELDQEAVGEWTGSEDLRTPAELSEDESIGEWSNPSDEERARTQRLQRRTTRRAKQDLEMPRRLPNFPRPPDLGPLFISAQRDDDIMSNPSEDGRHSEPYLGVEREELQPRSASNMSTRVRPLPPLPHSREGSQYSHHDPALAHSRHTSEQYFPGGLHPRPVQLLQPPAEPQRREALNPHARPFVFGTANLPAAELWTAPSAAPAPAPAPPPPSTTTTTTHVRRASFGKPLNVAAPEFKPGGFTFRPPPGVPQLAFAPPPPQPTGSRPLPTVPTSDPPRATQGREKRQRKASDAADEEDEDGVSHMSTFKFPSPNKTRHSAPTSPLISPLEGATSVIQNDERAPTGAMSVSVAAAEKEDVGAHVLPFPPTSTKPKRAPIPLDFKHPVSNNTIPAGMFKALVNGEADERTRRAVRSRLSSRDIFEHSPRPSLDDLNVPTISHRMGRTRMFTDPVFRDRDGAEHDDVFGSGLRRSSAPLRSRSISTGSDMSVGPLNLSRRVEMQQYEQRLEVLLDEKLEGVRRALADYQTAAGGQSVSPATEAMIAEVVTLFRTQLQESAAKGLDDTADGHGELDFVVLKDIIEQSQAELRSLVQRDIADYFEAHDKGDEVHQIAEELSAKTMEAVVAATQEVAMRVKTIEASRPSSFVAERDAIVRDLMNMLMPHLAALRPEPVDYEGLTMQLTQAVKPHISQLIDLASDKQETASLIVDKLVPILPSIQPEFDADAMIGRMTAELRRIVAPIDAHEIKEQVSDLVVARLDSRLAVRDRAFNVEVLGDKISAGVSSMLVPLEQLKATVEDLRDRPQPPVVVEQDLSSVRRDVTDLLSDLPGQLAAATAALNGAQADFRSQPQSTQSVGANDSIHHIETVMDDVAAEQKKLISHHNEFSEFCQDIIKHINALPEAMVEATKVLQSAHSDIVSRDASQQEEIRRLMNANAEIQVQLAKARGAHGQIRVEKDNLGERCKAAETDRDYLRAQVEALKASESAKATEAAASQARNAELEEALALALERLKAADVSAQTKEERLSHLEKVNYELSTEKLQLRSKVDSLEMRETFGAHEKAAMTEELDYLRHQNSQLLSQQSHLDELRHVTEQINLLANVVGQTDADEINELRRVRDRSKILEGEHTSLLRRFKDQEYKIASNEKIVQAIRQNLAQAQQRSVEWEKRAKEYEGELEMTRTKLDQTEQAHTQLDTDFSLVKLQLEERDAEERLAKDRQSKLRDQIAALEEQVARLQAETDQAQKKIAAPAPSHYRTNGHSSALARPASRSSTVYGDSRAGTPIANGGHTPNVKVATPPQHLTWDSIHAPRRDASMHLPMTPKAKPVSSYYRIPSPTPSNVSAAPTLGDDGWWS